MVRFVLWWHPFPASTDRSSRDRLGAFTPYSDRSAQNTLTTVLHNLLAHLRDLTYGRLMTKAVRVTRALVKEDARWLALVAFTRKPREGASSSKLKMFQVTDFCVFGSNTI